MRDIGVRSFSPDFSAPTLKELAEDTNARGVIDVSELLSKRRSESRRCPNQIIGSPVGLAILRSLFARGWNVMALGDDAIVLENPSVDLVLRFAQNWQAYGEFVSMAMGAENPHFPRFKHWEVEGPFSLAMVERLETIEEGFFDWQMVNLASALAHTLADSRPADKDFYVRLPDSLRQAVTALGEGADIHYYALDLGIENLLMRPSTKEIVFNDPWSPWGE